MRPLNEVIYGDLTFVDTHPAHTSAIAALTGLQTPAVENCRILELGCGTGFNLLAISQSLPHSHCTGVDLSSGHIDRANQVAALIGARNVEFYCDSIADFQAEPASFDYIIAHGVYTWVPPAIRDAMLALVQRCLSPNGVAYISYNTLPGWHLRNLIRDSLRFFSGTPSPRDAVSELTQSLLLPKSIYARTLTVEWAEANKEPDYYLAHEFLAPHNDPIYFTDFAGHAGKHQLQFLGEARFFTNSFAQEEPAQEQLAVAGDDPIRREQHMDWLVGRYFRQTLLCHAGHALQHDGLPENVLDANVALEVGKTTEDPFCLQILEQLQPALVLPAAALNLPEPLLLAVLWSGWRAGLWTIRTDIPLVAATPGERPMACPLARLQAAAGPRCTNRLHQRVTLTEEEQQLLLTLDGSRSINAEEQPILFRLAAHGVLIA